MKNRAAFFGVFTALALIFSYLESLIPIRFGIPGIKLGLANLLTVILLYKRNAREALLLSVVRVILSGFMFGNLFSIVYSLAGGILSLFVMAAVETYRVGYYFPVLLIAGVVTGLLIGAAAEQVLKRLESFRFES